jgi:SAM-dependent methyltransferase
MAKSRLGLLSGYLRRKRLAAALPLLTGRVLDLGSGAGLLAQHVPPERYYGWDINAASVRNALQRYPDHTFSTDLPDGHFDTAVALAVIEHVPEPVAQSVIDWIAPLKPGGRFILTTPHKAFRRVHEIGAAVGLAASSAADDHEVLFNRASLTEAFSSLPLEPEHYSRFLFGMNQLFVFRKL